MSDNESTSVDEIRLHGRLSGDSIEGGGTFLVQPDGRRFELVVPAGVVVPGSAADAPVLVSGRLAPEMASFRQQGRMFVVTAIELAAGRPSSPRDPLGRGQPFRREGTS